MRMGLPLKLVEIVKVAFGILLMTKKGWCGASSAQQRFLHAILTQCPTTAGSVQFCLLCCQPEPVPRSVAARSLQLTLQDPCRLPAWSGRTIHMACRTYYAPMHSHNPSQGTDQGPHCNFGFWLTGTCQQWRFLVPWTQGSKKRVGVVHLLHSRGCCMPF